MLHPNTVAVSVYTTAQQKTAPIIKEMVSKANLSAFDAHRRGMPDNERTGVKSELALNLLIYIAFLLFLF